MGVFKPFKLRLVDPLEDVPEGTGQGRLDGPRETPARSSGCPAPTPTRDPTTSTPPQLRTPRPSGRSYSSSGVSCTGSLVNCVSKLSRP